MKKLLFLVVTSMLLLGCNNLSNTPTKKAEEFLKKYQALDNSVLTDLNKVVDEDSSLNESQKNTYKDIMKKHYQSLSYEVKDETVDGNKAVVTVEISVTDFKKVLDEANNYMNNNLEQFEDENGDYSVSRFNDYKLEQLKEAKDKVRYTLELKLTKVNDVWTLDTLSQDIYDKINGVYNY